MRHSTCIWLLVATLAVGACARAPITGRQQLMLVSDDQAAEVGAQAYREVLAKSDIVKDERYVAPVRAVGQRIASVADRPDYRWQFTVIDDPKQVNAFALPGGKVAVYTGLFPVAVDTNGLAVVMSHEVAHVLARHGSERMSQAEVTQLGGSLLSGLLGGGPSTQAVLAAYGLGAQLGVLLPFSRTQESEADCIGLVLMARAGYDPRGAVEFWRRMERAARDGQPPEFLSTHPSHASRVENVEHCLGEASAHYQAQTAAPVASLPPVPRG